jgi:hypothetical protein
VQCKGGSEDIEMRRNRFTNAGERSVNMGGSTGAEFFRPPLSTTAPNFEARNIRAIANVFTGSTSPIAFVGCVDCLALNDTIVNPTRWILRILQETVTGGATFFRARRVSQQPRLFRARRSPPTSTSAHSTNADLHVRQ